MSTFKSGRSTEQGIRSCVVEGRKLYVTPKRFALMRDIIAKAEDADRGAIAAVKAAGVLQAEVNLAMHRGFDVVVDYELVD
jgi:hypothetical protein